MDVQQAIRKKRAIRVFHPDPVPKPLIQLILQAGRRAQSSKNTQPWHFIVVQDSSRKEALSKTGRFAGHLAGAPLCIVIATPDPATKTTIRFDAGQAAAYMQLAAWEAGIGSCLAAIYEVDSARAILGIPEDWFPEIAISFGKFDRAAQPPSGVRIPGRKSLEEIVHWEEW